MAKCLNSSEMLSICGSLTLLLLALACEAGASHGFIERKATQFVLDGSPFLFNGFNSYWMMHVAAEPSERGKVTQVFRDASNSGLSVCRTWAFSDGGDRALQVSPGVYSEQVFQGLDFVVAEAAKYGVRLILSFANNFKDFGGRAQYVQWARDAGAPVNGGEDDFYTNLVVKGYYKNHIQKVVSRINTITGVAYRDDPTIMAWELINEPRCQSDYSGRTVHNWVQEMATYTKSLDSKHLLEVGMEGFYGDSMPDKKQYNPGYQVGTDYISTNLINEIDFATIHAYPDIWLSGQNDGNQDEFCERWMWSHWDDAMKVIKKPLIFAEFGKSKKDAGYTESSRDAYLNDVYLNIYKYAKSGFGSMVGGLVWQVMAEGMEPYYDGYEIVLPENLATAAVVMKQSKVMSTLAHTLARPTREVAAPAVVAGRAQQDRQRRPEDRSTRQGHAGGRKVGHHFGQLHGGHHLGQRHGGHHLGQRHGGHHLGQHNENNI